MSFPRLVTDQDCRLGGTAMFDLIITWWFDDYIPVSCLLLIHPLEEVVHLNIKLDELRIRPYVIPFSFNQYIHRFLMVKWRFRLVEYFDFWFHLLFADQYSLSEIACFKTLRTSRSAPGSVVATSWGPRAVASHTCGAPVIGERPTGRQPMLFLDVLDRWVHHWFFGGLKMFLYILW